MTLIELIMVIAIGSFLMGGLALFTQQQVVAGTQMRDHLIAMDLAKLKMAEMNNLPYSSLPAGPPVTLPDEPSFPGFDMRRTVTTIATSGAVSVRQVQIDVTREGGSFSSPLARLITYRQSHVTFGDGS